MTIDCVPMTSSSTINLTDGRRFKVRTRDEIAKVCGPIEMVRIAPPEGDGGWYEHDGPLVAWFRLVPGVGWYHADSGRSGYDSVRLALRIIKDQP